MDSKKCYFCSSELKGWAEMKSDDDTLTVCDCPICKKYMYDKETEEVMKNANLTDKFNVMAFLELNQYPKEYDNTVRLWPGYFTKPYDQK